ncbi:PspC family transcriptional regulator [Bacteroidetes bacterium UKL13-3]|nr:PspC family transcriptional regulator [Bacteroidetes bacterium UKL13-3]HCP94651.1 PspC family transcriptional regulator [Bacteroidota bacterium]
MESIKYFVEKRVYGVCSYLGEKFGISSSRIRLYFIYTSFITMGSPIIIYLIMAFWLNVKKYIRNRKTVWDL